MNTAKTRTSLVLTLGLTLCALPAAFAGDKGSDKHFEKMDINGDGQISRAEHTTGAKKMFVECDANQDGIVTAAEMDRAMAAKDDAHSKHEKSSSDKIDMLDQNGDGQLTRAEHDEGADKMFAKMDKDGNGSLSREECDAGMKAKKKDGDTDM